MVIAFIYALCFLLIVPPLMGWESLGILGIVVGSICAWIIIGIAKAFESEKVQDEEILGTYVTEARYYEPWTEKIKHEDEETKEVTYEIVEHEEEWEITVAEGDSFPIDEERYKQYVEIFGNEEEDYVDHELEAEGEIIESGSCFVTEWPGTFDTVCYEYVHRSYKNPILKGSNVYESEKLTEEDIKKYHLVKYGEMSVYGTARDKDDAWELSSKLDEYNCWFREKNIKLNFILLKNAKSTQAMFWQQYWQNGKRNTINAVVGINDERKIEWAHVFGWQNEAVCIKLRNFIAGLDKLSDITLNFNKAEEILQKNYKVPDFKQYDFVQGQFPLKGVIISLTVCLVIFCGLFCRPPQYQDRACHHIVEGNYDLAKNELRKHLSKYPEDAIALNNLGVLHFRDKQFEDAEVFLSRAVEKSELIADDNAASIYRNRGTLYRETNRNKEAIVDYKKSIEKYHATKSYCILYRLYKDLGYKKSIWALRKKYENYTYRELKEDCESDEDQVTFLMDYADAIEGRGFMRLINSSF
ncbi:MAG: tetratricopeptide repeat protein [Elusimicrobiaceae bacterium]|nr:tetratricopeptide repeat protein [Elusimicrobiaceae bacterium]